MAGITVEELHNIAVSNMPVISPSLFRGMNEVISEMMGMEAEELGMTGEDKMYVLSNRNKSFGAVALLDAEMMKSITGRFGTVFVLLSSVHETLIVIPDDSMDVRNLRTMVHEVNETRVSLEERLSENVYSFSADEGLSIA